MQILSLVLHLLLLLKISGRSQTPPLTSQLILKSCFDPGFSRYNCSWNVTREQLRSSSDNEQTNTEIADSLPVDTSERSPFLRCARAMLSSQVRLSSGVLAYDLARLYWRSSSISGSFSCSLIWAVAISTVRMRFVRPFTSEGNAVDCIVQRWVSALVRT